MKRVWTWCALGILAIISIRAAHEYYVGLTEIDYNGATKRCEVALKVFTDDLELAVQNRTGKLCHLGTQREWPESDSLIQVYLGAHFSLAQADGERIKLSYLGRETELDVTWLYLESEQVQPLGALRVSNDMFLELYDDQVHIVQFESGEVSRSTLLRKGKTTDILRQ